MMEKSNSFLLVYGSETGQAQSIAEQIAEKSAEFGLNARLHCLEKAGKLFNIEEETCMVLVTSTTGDGDPPDNAAKFLRRIRKKTLSSTYLSQLHYTVLGLGDTNYNNFCKCGRDMDTRLEQLGAKRFYPTGLADDGVGLEIVVDPWLEGLYPALKKHLEQEKLDMEGPLSQSLDKITLGEKDPQSTSNGYSVNHSVLNGGLPIDKAVNDCNSVGSSPGISSDSNLNNNSSAIPSQGVSAEIFDKGSDKTDGSSSKPSHSVQDLVDDKGDSCSSDNSSKGNAATIFNGAASSEERTDILALDSVSKSADKILVSNGIGGNVSSDPACVPGKSDTSVEASSKGASSSDVRPEIVDVSHKCILRDSTPPLCDKDLTVPVLAPEFLKAVYTKRNVETEKLSFQNGCKLPSSASDITQASITRAKVLTHPGALKKTLWLRLSLKEQNVKYSPGDSISIICQNSQEEVQKLLERLKVSQLADQEMSLSLIPDTKKRRAAVPPHIHPATTLRHVLTACVSIRDVPSKALLRMLVEYTTDEKEKRRLQELCSKEGATEYTRCLREKGVSLLDILYAFPSCQPPMERVLEFLARLLPRPYSICSCPETNPNSLDIVFNIVDIPCDIVNSGHYYSRLGVCTGWLDSITTSVKDPGLVEIPMFFRSNQHFQPPSDISKPLILVGPGTGVSPYIGFLQQRALLKSRQSDVKYGETWLFTGCRHRDKDYLFRETLEELEQNGTLSRLCVSFSRDTNSSHRYVQDYMKSEGSRVANLIVEEEALIYVCGDAKNMSKDVSAAFQEILSEFKGFSADEAITFLMKKRLHKTYLEDVWT